MLTPRLAKPILVVATLSLAVAACERAQRPALSARPAAKKAAKEVQQGARATGGAIEPAANKVAKGIDKGVLGVKKGGDAVGKALGAK